MVNKSSSVLSTLTVLIILSGCGGSSGGSDDVDDLSGINEESSPNAGGSVVDSEDTESGIPENQESDPSTELIPDEVPPTDEPNDGVEQNPDSGNIENMPDAMSQMVQRDARIVITEPPFNADLEADDLSRLNLNSARINRAGDMAILGRGPGLESGDRLYTGSVFGALEPVLSPGDAIQGLPSNVRLESVTSASISHDGRALGIAAVSGASDFNALVESIDGEAHAIVSEGDALSIPGSSGDTLDRFVSFHNGGAQLALHVFPDSGSSGLFLQNGESLQFIASSGDRGLSAEEELVQSPLLADGCRVRFDDDGAFSVSSSGLLLFDAQLSAENGAQGNPAICPRRSVVINEMASTSTLGVGNAITSLVMYQEGSGFSELLGAGSAVPEMSDAVFLNVSLAGSLPESGLYVAFATIRQPSTGDDFDSWWLVSTSDAPRLIAIAGETVERASGDSFTFADTQTFRDRIRFNQDGSVGLLQQDWLVTGMAHPSPVPYSQLPVSGSSSLAGVANLNGAGFDGFPSSAFVSSIETLVSSNSSRLLFSASIEDAADSESTESAIWLSDPQLGITRVVGSGDVLETTGLPIQLAEYTSFSLPSSLWVIDGGWIVFIDEGSLSNDRFVLLPVDGLQ